jgi:hypothetical protein
MEEQGRTNKGERKILRHTSGVQPYAFVSRLLTNASSRGVAAGNVSLQKSGKAIVAGVKTTVSVDVRPLMVMPFSV